MPENLDKLALETLAEYLAKGKVSSRLFDEDGIEYTGEPEEIQSLLDELEDKFKEPNEQPIMSNETNNEPSKEFLEIGNYLSSFTNKVKAKDPQPIQGFYFTLDSQRREGLRVHCQGLLESEEVERFTTALAHALKDSYQWLSVLKLAIIKTEMVMYQNKINNEL